MKRKTPTKMETMGAGIAAAAVAACGIGGMEPGCKVRASFRLLDEFKRMSGTSSNNRSFGNADVTDTMTVNGRQRHQDSDGVIVCWRICSKLCFFFHFLIVDW